MKVKELKELIKDIPDEAEVYVECDHAQTPTKLGWVSKTDEETLLYYGEDLNWDDEIDSKDATAIVIGA